MPYEEKIPGDTAAGFPHMVSSVKTKKYNAFRYTPFGNTFTLNFAMQAIENENLGKNGVTDFLAVSLSSTDYIGHAFGPNSVEIEDTYIRLDKDIATFLQYLDERIGKGNYLFFLSADHGVSNNTAFLNEHHLPGGNFSKKELIKEINDSIRIKTRSNFDAILKIENAQVFLNQNIEELGTINLLSVKQWVVSLLLKKSFITSVFDYTNPSASIVPESIKSKLDNSYFASRSGDLQIIYAPNFFDGGRTGTTHGSWNPYDAHIPLLFYGWGIAKGTTHREIHMTDITPTLAALLNIQMPNGCVGQVIHEVIK
jgi:predicted AlkP superfamily pyrophosphatase or phosphodiesterase